MVSVHPQYIIDEDASEKAVIIEINEWKNIIKKLEELDDIETYDKAKKEKSDIISFDQAIIEIKNGK
jgi:hypothetical protein